MSRLFWTGSQTVERDGREGRGVVGVKGVSVKGLFRERVN